MNTISKGNARAGEFDFLAGHWRITQRRLKTRWIGSTDWEHFEGESSCWTTLGGHGSIEELRLSASDFRGLGIRLLDTQRGLWCDYWASSGSGLISPTPMLGSFDQGVGTFIANDDHDGEIAIHSRGIWDRITPNACRWQQAFSRDGGRHWEDNWFMDWVRVG